MSVSLAWMCLVVEGVACTGGLAAVRGGDVWWGPTSIIFFAVDGVSSTEVAGGVPLMTRTICAGVLSCMVCCMAELCAGVMAG